MIAPGRDEKTGRFVHGNAFASALYHPQHNRCAKLKEIWLAANNDETVKKCIAQLIRWCLADDPKVSLPALALWLDRSYGKAKERIEIKTTTQHSVNLAALSDSDLAQLQSLVNKAQDQSQVIDCTPEPVTSNVKNDQA